MASRTKVHAATLSVPISQELYVDSGIVTRSHINDPELLIGLVINPCGPSSPWSTLPVYCNNFKTQTYIPINLSFISEHGILSSDINSVSLHLFKYHQQEVDSSWIDAFTSPSPWLSETVTWENMPLMGTLISRNLFTSTLGWQHVDITSWTKSILENTQPNYGIVLRTYYSNEPASMYFSSRCYPGTNYFGCNIGENPYITVEYTPNERPSIPKLLFPPDLFLSSEQEVAFGADESLDPEGQQIYYRIDISENTHFSDFSYSELSPSPSWSIELAEGTYYWRVTALDAPHTATGVSVSETRSFAIAVDSDEEEDLEEDLDSPSADTEENISQDETEEEEPFAEESHDDEIEADLSTHYQSPDTSMIPEKAKPSSSEQQKQNSNTFQNLGVVLGTQKESFQTYCFIDYFKESNTWKVKRCDVASPKLEAIVNHGPSGTILYSADLTGSVPTQATIQITYYQCKNKSLWNPRTWFRCVQEKSSTEQKTVGAIHTIFVHVYETSAEVLTGKASFSHAGYFSVPIYSDVSLGKRVIAVRTNQHFALVTEHTWIDLSVQSPYSNSLTASSDPELVTNAFSFPFDHLTGVTQWHGNTAFQHPHTGIDFKARAEIIIAPAGGTVAATGYDTYYGSCLSGGYYVLIKHDNGQYSAYFHLTSSNKPDGTTWIIGEKVDKGQGIAISGHSGAWNCFPLADHLHYEIRKDRAQMTHTDPVALTAIDWTAIQTVNWQTYPGRLTGDNPHPTF